MAATEAFSSIKQVSAGAGSVLSSHTPGTRLTPFYVPYLDCVVLMQLLLDMRSTQLLHGFVQCIWKLRHGATPAAADIVPSMLVRGVRGQTFGSVKRALYPR